MIDDRDLGELPRIPPDLFVSERHRSPSFAGWLMLAGALGLVLGAAVILGIRALA